MIVSAFPLTSFYQVREVVASLGVEDPLGPSRPRSERRATTAGLTVGDVGGVRGGTRLGNLWANLLDRIG